MAAMRTAQITTSTKITLYNEVEPRHVGGYPRRAYGHGLRNGIKPFASRLEFR